MKSFTKKSFVLCKRNGCILKIVLNRKEHENALNPDLINELIEVFSVQAREPGLRLIYFSGSGSSFCSGTDLAWMRSSNKLSDQDNFFDADRLYQLVLAMQNCPLPILTQVHGVIYGGGIGLAASSDVVIADSQARFALSDTRQGLVPAIMLHPIIDKLGKSRTRELLTTGREFGALEAERFGLVHFVVDKTDHDAQLRSLIGNILACAPEATIESRQLIQEIRDLPFEAARHELVSSLSRKRTGSEAQEGLQALLENRQASWASPEWFL